MKTRRFKVDNLLEHCKRTINMMSIDTIKEALEYQCYRLDLECLIIEADSFDEYKRPVAIIPSITLNRLADVLENPNYLEPLLIDVLVLPITKKIEQKFDTTIGGRIWSVNRFTSMSAYGIAFNDGEFFKDDVTHSDLKFTINCRSNIYRTIVTVNKL